MTSPSFRWVKGREIPFKHLFKTSSSSFRLSNSKAHYFHSTTTIHRMSSSSHRSATTCTNGWRKTQATSLRYIVKPAKAALVSVLVRFQFWLISMRFMTKKIIMKREEEKKIRREASRARNIVANWFWPLEICLSRQWWHLEPKFVKKFISFDSTFYFVLLEVVRTFGKWHHCFSHSKKNSNFNLLVVEISRDDDLLLSTAQSAVRNCRRSTEFLRPKTNDWQKRSHDTVTATLRRVLRVSAADTKAIHESCNERKFEYFWFDVWLIDVFLRSAR